MKKEIFYPSYEIKQGCAKLLLLRAFYFTTKIQFGSMERTLEKTAFILQKVYSSIFFIVLGLGVINDPSKVTFGDID